MKGSMLIAMVMLVVIGISTFVASNFLKQRFTFLPRAQTSTTWSLDAWDEAANRCPDKGSSLGPCICSELGSDGICAPVGSTNVKGLTCIRNKWDTSWGCWGSPSSANVPGTPDSSSAPANSCGTIKSQYGTCPNWATENSCHQRLDPPGDPDFGKWFKCVNRWWNGPCESKEACDGTGAPPAEAPATAVDTSTEAPAGPVDRSGLSSCYNFSNPQNCTNLCVSGRPDVDPTQEWYCSDSSEGQSRIPGRYCCPETITAPPVGTATTAAPGTLDGACRSTYPYCYGSLTCKNDICIESTASPTPALTTTPTPTVVAGNEEGTCTAIPRRIKFVRSWSFEETSIGQSSCGNNVLVGQNGEDRVYRNCSTNSSPICLYTCYHKDQVYNCQGVSDQNGQEIVRILNATSTSIYLIGLNITKHRFLIFDAANIINLNGEELKSGDTRTVDFSNDPQVRCSGFSKVDAILYYTDSSRTNKSTPITPGQSCLLGIELLIIIK